MDDNLVERLRLNCKCMADTCTMCEAADEIERLRAEVRGSARRNVTLFGELQTAVEEINRLRSAVVLCPRCVEIEAQTSTG